MGTGQPFIDPEGRNQTARQFTAGAAVIFLIKSRRDDRESVNILRSFLSPALKCRAVGEHPSGTGIVLFLRIALQRHLAIS